MAYLDRTVRRVAGIMRDRLEEAHAKSVQRLEETVAEEERAQDIHDLLQGIGQ